MSHLEKFLIKRAKNRKVSYLLTFPITSIKMQSCLNAFGLNSKSNTYSKLSESQNLGQVKLGERTDKLELILELSDGNGSITLTLADTGLKVEYSKLNCEFLFFHLLLRLLDESCIQFIRFKNNKRVQITNLYSSSLIL